MAVKGKSGYGEMLEKVIEKYGLPDPSSDEVEFSSAVIEKFKEDPVWVEMMQRLLYRMQDMYSNWMFEESEDEMRKLQGRAIELMYILTLPNALKIIDKDKE